MYCSPLPTLGLVSYLLLYLYLFSDQLIYFSGIYFPIDTVLSFCCFFSGRHSFGYAYSHPGMTVVLVEVWAAGWIPICSTYVYPEGPGERGNGHMRHGFPVCIIRAQETNKTMQAS